MTLSRARVLLLVLQVLASLVFLWPLRARLGFPLDDAWIHQVVARTFAQTGTLGYRPGAYGAGATSYAWAALLAVGQRLHLQPVVFTDVLGVAAAVVTGQALLGMMVEPHGPVRRVGLADLLTILFACVTGDFVWMSLSGMEATLIVALSVSAIACVVAREPTARSQWLAGILSGAAALTRPDVIPLGALLAAWVLLRERRASRAMRVALPWILACLFYFVSNRILTGHAMPATMRGRRWLWIDSAGGDTSFFFLAKTFVFTWAFRLRQFTLGVGSNALFWIASGLAAFGVVTTVRERRRGVLAVLAWAALHFGIYVVILPVPGHGGRYQPLVPLLFTAMATFGAARLLAPLANAIRRGAGPGARSEWAGVLGAVAVGAIVLNGFWDWRSANVDATDHIARTEIAAGHRIASLPSDARIASFDIGAIGYFADRPVFDLGGLTDARVADAMMAGRVPELVRQEGISHVVLPKGGDDFPDLSNFAFRLGLEDNPAVPLTPLASFASEPLPWLHGIVYTQNATIRQVLSQVGPASCGPPRARAELHPRQELGIRSFAAERLDQGLEEAARAGLCVRIHRTVVPADVGDDDPCWDVSLGAVADVARAPKEARPWLGEARFSLAFWANPYLTVGDPVGAATVALHTLATVTRKRVDPCFFARLPFADRPIDPNFVPESPASTAGWGLLLALVIVAAASLIARARVVGPGEP